ncbi:MAG: hypothetical protein MR769_08495 [Campylobacter sp.]|uniref:hypothetical protein n=1 Tax=Campylobacter sp. TaxID=205 RepID=UPI002AA67DAB|nr:hypothetical protein [Campylobacter sp.]MCI6344701.1 hypothetical protein [Campylobacter sp.]
MSKDKSKKWVISAPLFYNYARIPIYRVYRDCPVKPDNDTRFVIPRLAFFVILRLDRGISSQINLEFPASLRGSKATEAISFKA